MDGSERCCLTNYLAHFCSNYLAQLGWIRAGECTGFPLGLTNYQIFSSSLYESTERTLSPLFAS